MGNEGFRWLPQFIEESKPYSPRSEIELWTPSLLALRPAILPLYNWVWSKISCMFPVTLPQQVFTQKNPYPEAFSATKQHETCIQHTMTFMNKKIIPQKYFNALPTLFFSDCYRKQKSFFLSLISDWTIQFLVTQISLLM